MPARTFRPITEESFDDGMCEIAAGGPPDGRRVSPALPGTFRGIAVFKLSRAPAARPRAPSGTRRPGGRRDRSGATRPRKRAVPVSFPRFSRSSLRLAPPT